MLREDNKSKTIEEKFNVIIDLLKKVDFVDSVLLFGSRARGKSGSVLQ